MERFILSCAEETNIDLEDLGFHGGIEELKDAFKRIDASYDSRITKLFRALKDAEDMRRLSDILNYLKVNKFNSDIKKLKGFFPNV